MGKTVGNGRRGGSGSIERIAIRGRRDELGLDGASPVPPHGFRSTFRDWAAEVDGCSILVTHVSRRRVGHLFVVRTDDGLVVKRAGRDASGAWQLVSDNPNTHVWPPRPWPSDAVVVGEVKWAARTFA